MVRLRVRAILLLVPLIALDGCNSPSPTSPVPAPVAAPQLRVLTPADVVIATRGSETAGEHEAPHRVFATKNIYFHYGKDNTAHQFWVWFKRADDPCTNPEGFVTVQTGGTSTDVDYISAQQTGDVVQGTKTYEVTCIVKPLGTGSAQIKKGHRFEYSIEGGQPRPLTAHEMAEWRKIRPLTIPGATACRGCYVGDFDEQ